MVGIMCELIKYNYIKHIKCFFGTSVGSIICLLLNINYNDNELYEFIINFKFDLLAVII